VGFAFGQQLIDMQGADGPVFREGQMAFVDIGEHKLAGIAQSGIEPARQRGRRGTRRQWYGIHGGDAGLPIQEFQVAEPVEEVETRFGVFFRQRAHAGKGIKTETDEEIVLRKGPRAMIIGFGPHIGCLRETHFRRERFNGNEIILAGHRVKGRLRGIEQHERTAHVGVMRPGEKSQPLRAGHGMGLVTRVDALRVIAEDLSRFRAVRVGGPDAVEMGGRPVHVVPADIGDAPVVQHLRMPLAGLVSGKTPYRPVRVQPVQRVGGQRFPGIVAAREPAAPGGHEGDAAIGQRAGIEVIVGAVGQRAQIPSVGVHRAQVETAPLFGIELRLLALGTRCEGEVEGLPIV